MSLGFGARNPMFRKLCRRKIEVKRLEAQWVPVLNPGRNVSDIVHGE